MSALAIVYVQLSLSLSLSAGGRRSLFSVVLIAGPLVVKQTGGAEGKEHVTARVKNRIGDEPLLAYLLSMFGGPKPPRVFVHTV